MRLRHLPWPLRILHATLTDLRNLATGIPAGIRARIDAADAKVASALGGDDDD